MGEREEFVKKAAKKYSKGKYTATQTGARQFAEGRKNAAELKSVLESVGDMENFEDKIKGGSRPKRTKR